MNKYSRKRNQWINSSREELLEIAKAYQQKLIEAINEKYIDMLDIEGKNIVFNTRNMLTLSKLSKLLDDIASKQGDALLEWFKNQFETNAEMQKGYFSDIISDIKKAYSKSYDNLFLRYGIINGIFLQESTLFDASRIKEPIKRIKALTIQAIAQGKSYKDFQKSNQKIISPKDKAGVIENHFRTTVYDTFQQVDRSFGNDMALELDLNYAYYSDGLQDTSRQFCIDRVGKVFTRQEILGWHKLNWQGKPSEYDPFTDVGGHNCTHTLDWITYDIAVLMRPDLKK